MRESFTIGGRIFGINFMIKYKKICKWEIVQAENLFRFKKYVYLLASLATIVFFLLVLSDNLCDFIF